MLKVLGTRRLMHINHEEFEKVIAHLLQFVYSKQETYVFLSYSVGNDLWS